MWCAGMLAAHVPKENRELHLIFLAYSSPCSLRLGLSLKPELAVSVWLASKPHAPLSLLFITQLLHTVLGAKTQVLMLVQQVLRTPIPLSRPLGFVTKDHGNAEASR